MQTIQDEMIIYGYEGALDEHRNKMLLSAMQTQANLIKEKGLKGILVSMQQTQYGEGEERILELIRALDRKSQVMKIPICLIDYTVPAYQLLKRLTKETCVKLFKNSSSARLFLDPKGFKGRLNILIYDRDVQNSQQLAAELSKYGYTVKVAMKADEFKRLGSEQRYDMIITQSALNQEIKQKKGTLSLSKELIVNLPVFMDTAVETLVTFTGLEAQKSAHAIKRFQTDLPSSIICSVMRFKGDLQGSFVLVFPRDIAAIAIESLLGEKVEEDDTATIMDGVGEFCNIITGSTKTALVSKNIKVLFDLPKNFTSLEAIQKDVGENSGVWIDMQLADRPFYMFITD